MNNYMTLRVIIVSVSFIMVSSTVICVMFEHKDVAPNVLFVSDINWFDDNLYRVDTYKEVNGGYAVTLLQVEPSADQTFSELCETFKNTKYSIYNSYFLSDGVNCQGMAVYIADWCKRNGLDFELEYTMQHVSIIVSVDDVRYKFNFTENPEITMLQNSH